MNSRIEKLHALIQQFEAMGAWGMAVHLRLILADMKEVKNETK